MMPSTPNKSRLPDGFIELEDAYKLIEKDTRESAVVDIKWMMDHILWVEKKHNFNIPLLKTVDGRVVENGHVYVYVDNEVEMYTLRQKIQEHYEKLTGQKIDINGIGLKAVSTMVNEKNTKGQPIHNTDSKMEFGSEIQSGVSNVIREK